MSTIHGLGGRTRGRGTPIGRITTPPAIKSQMTVRKLTAEEIDTLMGQYPAGKLKPPRCAMYVYGQHKAGDGA